MSNDEPPLNPFYYQTWVDSNGVKRIFCADGLWRIRDDCSADGILLADLQANESELTTLRESVRELEEAFETHTSCIADYSNKLGASLARIRELEEAMPDVNSLKGWATVAHYTCMDSGLEMALNAMVNRIEKVMKR